MTAGLRYYIGRLFTLPPHHAVRKVLAVLRSGLASRAEKMLIRMFGDHVTDEEFSGAVAGGIRNAIEQFRSRPNILLHASGGIEGGIDFDPEDIRRIIDAADAACAHRFDLLGSGDVSLGERIDWHRDFKSGYRWDPKTFYRDIEIPLGKGDIKVPWELSRFQHLTVLGQAYEISKNEKYAAEFVRQIEDWIERNPVKLGPNWACTMDVAIRAANWLAGWEYFRNSPSVGDAFLKEFLKGLLIHGRFIRGHLENYGGNTSNHYLSDISGLFMVAAMVPELGESRGWLEFARAELEEEMRKQVYDDGSDFEASTCYHRLALELLFFPALLAGRLGMAFSSEYLERLKKMFCTMTTLTKQNGRMPQIGDNDNGRFLRFELPDEDILDMKYLAGLAAVFFDEPSFKVEFANITADHVPGYILPVSWIFGQKGVLRWMKMPQRKFSSVSSAQMADAGWHVFRSDQDYMIVSCGPNGQKGNGGHAHNDKLSFELSLGGEDIIVDPGTYLYTPDPIGRNHFRSTGMHNTVMAGQKEQNPFVDGLLFVLPDVSRAVCKRWIQHPDNVEFEGMHYGYQPLNGCIHRRAISYFPHQRKWVIRDAVEGNRLVQIRFRLHCAPGVTIRGESPRELYLVGLHQKARLMFSQDMPAVAEPYQYSPSYGKSVGALRLGIEVICDLPHIITWEIQGQA